LEAAKKRRRRRRPRRKGGKTNWRKRSSWRFCEKAVENARNQANGMSGTNMSDGTERKTWVSSSNNNNNNNESPTLGTSTNRITQYWRTTTTERTNTAIL